MAKNVEHIQHVKSNVVLKGKPKLPQPGSLVEGELAINYAEGVETISIKNSSGDIVTFSSDDYYSKQKLGSAFTDANSAVTVTEYIEENELIVSTALNDLKENKLDSSAYTEYWVSGTGVSSVVINGSSGTASGNYSVAEGQQTSATSVASHSEGNGTNASGTYSHAEGNGTIASGYSSHAEGQQTSATSYSSHAEGNNTKSTGSGSHAEGNGTIASESGSHAEGGGTSATSIASHAEGQSTSATGQGAHAEGAGTIANGFYSHAEGVGTSANTQGSHAEGQATLANDYYSHAEGDNTKSTGYASHTEGQGTSATSVASHAEGSGTKASGNYSHAEGSNTVANGDYSHSEGWGTSAVTSVSHAEGYGVKAVGTYSHAEGQSTIASGNTSHVEGYNSQANGDYSHAEGYSVSANSTYSHAEGVGTITTNRSEHASGQYNVSVDDGSEFGSSGRTLFTVGNGTADDARHNAFEIRQNGDIYIVNKDGYDVKLQDEIGNITVDQVIDETTSGSTNPVSSKAVYDAVTDNELVWTNAYVTMSGIVSSHTVDSSIHVTSSDKDDWNDAVSKSHTHGNKSALDAITGNVGTMAYESTNGYSSATQVNTALSSKLESSDIADFFDDAKFEDSGTSKVINFYNGNTIKATINADDFIKDGMIDTVSAGTSGSTTVLVITWNTDAGKSQTILDIGDMFEADNYYTKSETSGATEISDALADKIASGDVVTAITESNSGSSAPVSVKVVAENEFVISTALNDLNANKLDATAYTPTDLSNYYTKSQTSGATELSTAFSAKANTATTLAGYGITDAYTKTYIDDKLGTGFTVSSVTEVIESNERVSAIALNDLKRNKLDVSAFTEYSGAVNTTINSKASQTDLNTLSGTVTAHTANTTMHLTSTEKSQLHTHTNKTYLDGITGSVGTMAYQNTSSYSSATQVNTALGTKLDATAYTPTDLSNYYTKSETSGATELSTVFGTGFTVSSITEVIKEDERVTSEALNDLNTRIGTGFSDSSVTVVMESKADKTEDLDGVKLKKITQSAYDALVQAETVDPNTLYIITDNNS